MKKTNYIWGLLLIVLGIIIGLNSLEVISINLFFKGWWTLFIIIPCLLGLFTNENKTGDIIGLIIGILLLLSSWNIIPFNILWKLLIPIILVIIGVSLIYKDTIKNKIERKIIDKNITEDNVYYATFSGQNLNFEDKKLDNMELNAIFGGIKCNYKDSIIDKDIIIKTSSIFGGTTLILPKGYKVKVTSTSIFGGVDNNYKDSKEDTKIIYINATCLFGGVEIK